MDKEFISFDIKTGMKNIIGRDLITDDFIAIYELVKNSYDAYADYVTITFNDDEIIITDNGKGMAEEDIKEKWLAVAYSAKKDGSEDNDIKRSPHLNNLKSRRYYAGAKGVGRFSCDRLGNVLELTTTHISAQNTFKIEVDWANFELDAKQSFNSIQIPLERNIENPIYNNNKNHGTILRITKLNSSWNETRLLDLKHSLEKIINPFSSDQNDFTIEILANKYIEFDFGKRPFQQINGKITNSILNVLKIKTTEINVTVDKEKITTKITDRGSLIYHIEEQNPYANLVDNLEIGLYFLNRSAKINFGKIMDIEPINYGSIFLFKNGFRVQPYGETGDDSWSIDKRKQQGYNRFLGTRDLFGKVDLVTDKLDEFKEVSSRDGGLVETIGKKILFDIFTDKALKRLERYVAGVLWGEGFKRKNYFINEDVADSLRDGLKNDQFKDSYEDVLNNVGSKIDFVNLIKSLSDERDVKIIAYNKDLVDLVNAQLDIVQPKFISELEKIAEKTNDTDLFNQIKLTEDNFKRIIQEKDEAIKRAELEEQRRIEAEKKAKEEELKRIEAERKQKEEEEKRHKAELETAKKETERALAELAKLQAEKRAIDEQQARKAAEKTLEQEIDKNTYLSSTRRTLSSDAEDLIHSVKVSVIGIDESLEKILNGFKKEMQANPTLYTEISNIKLISERVKKLSMLITKSNFKADQEVQKVDVVKYIKEYIDTYSFAYKGKIDINYKGQTNFITRLSVLDLSIIIDNLISNSQKANAKKIEIEFQNNGKELNVFFHDNGDGLDLEMFPKPEAIFSLGVKSKNEGSGIGLYSAKKKLNKMYGDIQFVGNNILLKGATFKLIFR
jgi:signal transduction histidine kinase